MNKKTLFIFLLSILLLPSLVFAVSDGPAQGSSITIQGMVDAAVQTTLYIASGIVVILWIVTGILFLTAQGDPAKVGAGKKALLASVAGTLLIIIASSAIGLVGQAFGI